MTLKEDSPDVRVIRVKAKAFIKQGQAIKKGDTLLIIEAMKTFNPIKSEKSGKIEKILVNDSEPVEFGQPLVVIK